MNSLTLYKIIGLCAALLLLVIVAYTYFFYGRFTRTPNMLLNFKDQGIVLTDRNNKPFYFVNNAKFDDYVPLLQISEYMPKAIIAAEDRNFYSHNGLSLQGIVRSAILNLKAGSLSYGGSTITQQLVKNTLLTPERSILRKFQEAILAINVEIIYPKDKILEMYMNTIYYGDGAVGINEAARHYFNTEPKNLTLAQSAYIAGMIKYPSLLSPYTGNKKYGLSVQQQVLDKMVQDKLVSREEAEKAKKQEINFQRGDTELTNEAPHFALMVEQQLKEMYGNDVIYDGLTVKTSLDMPSQQSTQEILKEHINKNAHNGVSNGSVVVMDPSSGEVYVLVGSKDWFDERYGRINMAAAPRQPGSSFKPIVYALAIEEGLITPASVLQDRPKTYVLETFCPPTKKDCKYSPKNFDGKFRGPVTVRRALSNSLNIPAVEVMNKVGVSAVVDRAADFGITTLKDETYYGKGLSLVLGSAEVPPLEMADAYATFANHGKRPDPIMILEVKDKFGTVIHKSKPKFTDVLSPQTAYLITSMLSDTKTRAESFGNLLTTPFPSAVKTGTTENFRDAWTIGYTPSFVTAVWVGNNDGSYIYNLPGSLVAAPIWKDVMREMTDGRMLAFERPEGIVEANICNTNASGSARTDVFIEGTQPSANCPRIRRPRITADIASLTQDIIRKSNVVESAQAKDDDKKEQKEYNESKEDKQGKKEDKLLN